MKRSCSADRVVVFGAHPGTIIHVEDVHLPRPAISFHCVAITGSPRSGNACGAYSNRSDMSQTNVTTGGATTPPPRPPKPAPPPSRRRPAPRAGRGHGAGAQVTRWNVAVNVCRVAVVGGFILLWEYGSGNPKTDRHVLVDEFFVSKPSEIWDAFTGWIEEGVLLDSILITLQETVVGFLIGASLGLVTGFVLGVNPFLSAVFRPIITALNSIPRLALVPLFILWFGLGIPSKLALVATIVFFLVFYSTYEGVADVDREQLDVLRLMKAKRWQLHAKVTLPSAMTWIIAGLRVSVPYALVAAVTAEMIASNAVWATWCCARRASSHRGRVRRDLRPHRRRPRPHRGGLPPGAKASPLEAPPAQPLDDEVGAPARSGLQPRPGPPPPTNHD